MSWKQNLAAVAATVASAMLAALFSSAFAGAINDPQSLTALGTPSVAIHRHAKERQCAVHAFNANVAVISGPCFGFEEEGVSTFEFDANGNLKVARIRFSGSSFALEKMRIFRAALGRPFEQNGWKSWSLGRESWAFRFEGDGWVLVKRFADAPTF